MLTLPEAGDDPFFEHVASINAAIGSACADWTKEYLNFLHRRSVDRWTPQYPGTASV
jgi:hypothetical protein